VARPPAAAGVAQAEGEAALGLSPIARVSPRELPASLNPASR
jgi:hypothetical protein